MVRLSGVLMVGRLREGNDQSSGPADSGGSWAPREGAEGGRSSAFLEDEGDSGDDSRVHRSLVRQSKLHEQSLPRLVREQRELLEGADRKVSRGKEGKR